ncbi:MAG: hypothetical protein DRR19_10500 [Candidatus Parabeggiatoa sp. nov. 1]|nr:MAG: hypothetical protein DRR19_10500 [Gammaproteobacteria bacterium]
MNKINQYFNDHPLEFVILGALFTSIWASFGESILNFLLQVLVSVVTLFSQSSYIDFLHSDIGKGISGQIPFFGLLYLVVMFILLVPILKILGGFLWKTKMNPNNQLPPPGDGEFPTKKHLWHRIPIDIKNVSLIVASVVGMIFFTSYYIKSSYTNNAVNFIERSIEIVSPYVDETERLKLRSQYRAVDNFCKFNKLYNDLYSITDKNQEQLKTDKVNLPIFQSFSSFSDDVDCN